MGQALQPWPASWQLRTGTASSGSRSAGSSATLSSPASTTLAYRDKSGSGWTPPRVPPGKDRSIKHKRDIDEKALHSNHLSVGMADDGNSCTTSHHSGLG